MKNYPHDEVCQSILEQDWVSSCSNGATSLVSEINPGNMRVYSLQRNMHSNKTQDSTFITKYIL